ncbi:RHS repeat domain-containing protein [Flavobacterium columnare]|uniref:RHS repeat domain-containing protein n=1 Tax=Flavobacterium columnare TaxID=996 RepID=UPI00403474CA
MKYYPFGSLVPNRHGYSKDYRYGFNGKELDNELKGEGNSLDYGNRMLDTRIGRWFAVDKKERKYPSESSYIFVSNNPIIAIDPDGDEKIVVSGGADLHNKNRQNFTLAARNQIRQYKKELQKSGSKEKVSWLILDKDYTSSEKKALALWAKKNGIDAPVYVKSADEVVNYINSKSLDKIELSDKRSLDPITGLAFMSHGVPSAIPLGYENTGWTGKRSDPSVFDSTDISNINSSAFSLNSKVNLFSCNAATPLNMEAKDYPSIETLVNDAMTGNNLVKTFSEKVPQATITGYIGQTSYMKVNVGQLPSGATLDGSYSPTVNGESPNSINVKMKDGKVIENK